MPDKDEFFVGYLKTPQGIARFYKVVVPLLILVGLGVGLWLSSGQKSAGQGAWDLSAQREISGYLTVDPYPVVHFVGEKRRSVILVQQGKRSATDMARPYTNRWVTVSGFAIDRGDWSMLELLPTSSFQVTDQESRAAIDLEPLGMVSLQGEIIDSKCFLGVMKPGSGKVHRACAALCLRGGMPPMFVVKNEKGERFGYLLMHKNGESASLDLAERVAMPVTLTGEMERRGDILYIRYDKERLTRLTENQLLSYGETLAQLDKPADSDRSTGSPLAMHDH